MTDLEQVAEGIEQEISAEETHGAVCTPSPLFLSTPAQKGVEAVKEIPDPDRFLMTAKQLVVDNYNKHRDSRSRELTISQIYIVWFTKTLGNWKAIVESPVARGLLWEVTFNCYKNEAYITIYKKLNNVKIYLGGTDA